MRPALTLKTSRINALDLNGIADNDLRIRDLLNDPDPVKALQNGKIMAKAWAKMLPDDKHLAQARSFMHCVMFCFWNEVQGAGLPKRKIPAFTSEPLMAIDESVAAVAGAIGKAASQLELITASYELGNIYTAILPEQMRSGQGIFYTPPALTHRLLAIAEKAGVNWQTAKVIDPACGGGAFLMPVALKMAAALKSLAPTALIKHIETHLKGFEIDPFGAWLTQVFVEVALKDELRRAHSSLASLVEVRDSLNTSMPAEQDRFDLVIGNPPYGKVKLTNEIRERYADSLYGHANYYGMFTHLALDLVKTGGVIGFLTPTSFLSGEYFKKLRQLIRIRSHVVEIDFVDVRKGVFEDVLQETMLTIYKNSGYSKLKTKVNQINMLPEGGLHINSSGGFAFPKDRQAPWILPRNEAQTVSIKAMSGHALTLQDYGYKISTGPLVWNRHKEQLLQKKGVNRFPIIWAEAISQNGQFILRYEKKNHAPFFKFEEGNEALLIKQPCLLLQRTTSKEQVKRLVAAPLPKALIEEYQAVVVENHLNMILPIVGEPIVSLRVLSVLLNSVAVNEAFKTISGSVAVSAYELESLPLPAPHKLKPLIELIEQNAPAEQIEQICNQIYHYSTK